MFTLFSLLVFCFRSPTLMKRVTHKESAFCLRALGLLFIRLRVVYCPLCLPLVDPLHICIYMYIIPTDVLCQQYWTFRLRTYVERASGEGRRIDEAPEPTAWLSPSPQLRILYPTYSASVALLSSTGRWSWEGDVKDHAKHKTGGGS